MVVFLLRCGRKEKSFRQAFYTFFIAVTLADCAVVVVNRLSTYVYLYDFMNQMAGNERLSLFFNRLQAVLTHLTYIATNFQPLCHTIIALNRFTAFAYPVEHKRIWNRRAVLVLLITIATIALLLTGIPSVAFAVKFGTMTRKEAARNEEFMLLGSWDYAWASVASVLRAFNLILCCIVGFFLNVGTVAMFVVRRKSGNAQKMPKGQDVKLFVHSLFIFVIQLYLTFQNFVNATDTLGLNEEWGYPTPPWVPKWLRLWSQKWLAGDRSCNPDDAGAKDYCGKFYLILSGYLWLSDGLTLAELTEHIFALSGALFLLIVSGNVRNAYFRFHFKCVGRRHGRVFQVVSTNDMNTVRRSTLTN